jgi:crotonobetainyl-CoA:carnitine CoA-transferase CaiB-like acyl-CoA transferase
MILGLADADSTSFRTNALRVNNRTELRHLLQKRISVMTIEDIVPKLLKAAIPYGVVKNLKEVFGPETERMLLHSDDRIGVRTFAASPFHVKQSHFLPPPHFGEHTRQILSQSIQMTPDAIDALVSEGIVS